MRGDARQCAAMRSDARRCAAMRGDAGDIGWLITASAQLVRMTSVRT